MAAVTGTISNVRHLDYVGGPTFDSSNDRLASCIIFVSFTGTYAQSDDGTIASVTTAISNARRDGKTVALRYVAGHSAGLEGTTPIAVLGTSGSATFSGSTITVALSDGTLVAEHANAAMSTMTKDIGIYVGYEIDE
jgi:hypothetical protein